MTREEVLANADENVTRLIGALRDLGITAAFVRTLDNSTDFRLICLQSLTIGPLLQQAANRMSEQEGAHRC